MALLYSAIKSNVQGILKGVEQFASGGTYESEILTVANEAQLELASRIYFPRLKKTATVTCTTSNYAYDMPSDFLRAFPRFTKAYVSGQGTHIREVDLSYLDTLDPEHTDTSTNAAPSYYAIDGTKVYIYPMVSCTLSIQNYVRIPTDMVDNGASTVDLISEGVSGDKLVKRAIVAYVCEQLLRDWLKMPAEADRYLGRYERTVAAIEDLKHVATFNRRMVPG